MTAFGVQNTTSSTGSPTYVFRRQMGSLACMRVLFSLKKPLAPSKLAFDIHYIAKARASVQEWMSRYLISLVLPACAGGFLQA